MVTLKDLKGSLFSITFTPQASTLTYTPTFDYDLYVSKYLIIEYPFS